MKRIVLYLLVCLMSFSTLYSQNLNKTDFKPHVKNGKLLFAPEIVNEKLSGILSQYWIPNEWHDGGRFIYEYNSDGNITTMYMDSLHNGDWIRIMSMIVEYDGNKPVTDISHIYNIDGTEEWSTKNVTSYNGDKVQETLQYHWDANDWVLSTKQVYEYSNNLVSKILDYGWNEFTSAWDPESENHMTYDSQGREIEGLVKNWDSQESAFVNSGITTTEYYKDLLISEWDSKSWDVATNDWSTENYNLTINQYNNNDKMIESVFTYSMGFGGFSFVMKDSTIYEYDANNYEILATEYNWQDMVGYAPFTKIEYNNDINGNVLNEIYYSYLGVETWVPYEKNIYTYDGTVAVEDEEELPTDFSLEQNYPNPFNPTTTISYNVNKTSNIELNIYDMLGNHISTLVNTIQAKGKYSVNFNAENLASGTYIYSLKYGNKIITRKCLMIK